MTLTSWLVTQLTSGFSFMLISRTSAGRWVIGDHEDAVWSCDAPSVKAAKERYRRARLPVNKPVPWPTIEPGSYVIPNEFTPLTRQVAKLFGARFYVGGPCKHHPLNHVRDAKNKRCVVCAILKIYL